MRAVRNYAPMDDYVATCWPYFGNPLTHISLQVLMNSKIPGVPESYLCLSESELRRELRSLRQREVLSLLEAPLQSSELVAGVDRPWLADLFWFPIHHADLGLWLFFH